ncbi:MAG: hypothetical protein HZC02_03040 [Candidatus Levybacteria bacterium]|nr:hypothetical protein [Candidatus Levybacteria bacterium]
MEKLRSIFHRRENTLETKHIVVQNLDDAIDLMRKRNYSDPVEVYIEEEEVIPKNLDRDTSS